MASFGVLYGRKIFYNPLVLHLNTAFINKSMLLSNTLPDKLLFKNRYILLFLLCFVSLESYAQKPVPAFTASPVSGCAPLIVSFTDQSVNANSWKWDLGNGATSTQQNPSVIYTLPGTYTISLTVTNASGSATLVKTNYITVTALPVVNFTSSVTSGCAPLKVQFTDQSTPGTVTGVTYFWDFGDGGTSTLQNPEHIYAAAGSYTVSLVVTNETACSFVNVKPSLITVFTGLKSDFSNSAPLNCRPPEQITFTNLSSGPGTLSYQWDFGDGNTSTNPNPQHNYSTAGPFTVKLITTSSNGCTDTLVRNNQVLLNDYKPKITAPATGCINGAVVFQNQSAPLPPASLWKFSDGTTSVQTDPVKQFPGTGNYTITLINQYPTCNDTTTALITINNKPTAAFETADTISCKAPFTVSYTDKSTGATSWNWDFGDGNSSIQQNPTHTYSSLGNFTVRLIVINADGCADTLIRNNYIRIQKPVFNPQISPTGGCRILNTSFTANTTAVDSIASWYWDLGNGVTSTLENPGNTYDSGTYSIKLVVVTKQGCTDSVILNNAVRAGVPPKADFNTPVLNVCAASTVAFTDLTTGNPDQWSWSFGDGGTSALQNPTHIFTDTGRYTIKLTAYNNRCADSVIKMGYTNVLPPIASFRYSVNCSVNSLQVRFTDRSLLPSTWSWNFGDGFTSTVQNPTHKYASPGTYTITLTVTRGSCSNQTTRTITLYNETVDFNAAIRTVCKNKSVQFTSIVSNPANIASYDWFFGDATTSNQPNPVKVYSNSGNYTVRLIITDKNGCKDTVTKPTYIRVNGPTANLTVSQPSVCINTAAVFTNLSNTDGINAINTRTWDLGNGTRITTNTNPLPYIYPTAGTYNVKIIVTDAAGCADSVTKPAIIKVLNPDARFSVDTPSCPGATITFNNQTSGTDVPAYSWAFGDGGTSNQVNPTHSYLTTGVYTIRMIVTESIGCKDTAFQNIRIAKPKAAFTINDSNSICNPFQAKFTNTSSFYNASAWTFGDGGSANSNNINHYYTSLGSFPAKLVITSPGGCQDSATTIIRIGRDTGTLNYAPLTGCGPMTVTLATRTDVPLNYTWDLGDGNILTTKDSNLVHVYDAGFYVPKVIIKDGSGCFGIIEGVDTIKAFGSRPNFGALVTRFCDNGTVQFIDSTYTPDIITAYLWNFGDGNTSALQNPQHFYAATGSYDVTLTVWTRSGCVNSKTIRNFINIVPTPQINIIGDTSFCVPASFQLNGQWTNPDTSAITWKWTIGAQQFATQTTPVVNIAIPGSYPARLIVTNSSGCSDTAQRIVEIRPLPNVNAGNDTTICLGTSASLHATGAASYTWSPATYLSCTNCPNPTATAQNQIQYLVTGVSQFGCVNKDSMIVFVKKPFNIKVGSGDTICVGQQFQLSASGAETYKWTPATGLNNPLIANPIASPTTTTVYMIVGSDSLNCFHDTLTVPVVVYDYPVITGIKDTIVQFGSVLHLTPQFSADVTNVLWTPPVYLSCNTCPAPVATPEKTTRYQIRAVNDGGCISYKYFKLIVLCNKDNIFIPTAFTPNGDQLNDRFYIRGNGLQNIMSLKVFDRWGGLLFSKSFINANDKNEGWDGTFKGKPQPPGIYTYTAEVICGDGSIIPVKGIITLIR